MNQIICKHLAMRLIPPWEFVFPGSYAAISHPRQRGCPKTGVFIVLHNEVPAT